MDVIAIALAKSFAQNSAAIAEINRAIAAAEELNSKQDDILDEIKRVNVDQKEAIEALQDLTSTQSTNISNLQVALKKEVEDRTAAISDLTTLMSTKHDEQQQAIATNTTNITTNTQSIVDNKSTFDARVKYVDEMFVMIDKNIAKAKSEAIAEILGGAVEQDYDTLKEVVEWIESDTTGSAQLITRVTNLETYTTELKNVKIPKIEADITTLFDRFPTISALDNGKFVKVENGKYSVVEVKFSTIYTGDATPAAELGTDGDLYIQYE